jgi:hypothetical protein
VARQSRPQAQSVGTARCRIRRLLWNLVRVLRLGLGLIVLTAVALGLFVHHVGVPEPLLRHITAQLENRGWAVTFSRLRLRWYRGVVAEGLHLCRVEAPHRGQLFAEDAEVVLDWPALRSGRLQLNELRVRSGRLVLAVPGPSQTNLNEPDARGLGSARNRGAGYDKRIGLAKPGPMLWFNDIHGQVRFHSDAVWELHNLRACCLGVHLQAAGVLKHAAGLAHWPWLTTTGRVTEAQRARYHAVWQWLRGLQFDRPPELSLQFNIDGLRTNWVQAALRLTTAQVSWANGTASNLSLHVQLEPPAEPTALPTAQVQFQAAMCRAGPVQVSGLDGQARCQLPIEPTLPVSSSVELRLARLDTPRLHASDLNLRARLASSGTNGWPRVSAIEAVAAQLRCPWAEARRVQLTSRLEHGATNFLPARCALELQTSQLVSSNVSAPWTRLQAEATLPALDHLRWGATNLLWSQRLSNLPCRVTLHSTNATVWQWQVDRLELQGHWQPPHLTLQVEAGLYDGTASGQARLDTGTAEAVFELRSRFNLRPLCSLLATNLQQAVAACAWQSPPRLQLEGWLDVPVVTNLGLRSAQPGAVVRRLQGRVDVGPGAVEGIEFEALQAQFQLTNQLWHVQDLVLHRPEGSLEADGTVDPHSGQFAVRFRSSCDPQMIKLLVKNQRTRALLDDFRLSAPPRIAGQLWGNPRQPESLGLVAEVAATNFWFRDEPILAFTATVAYSNRFLSFVQPQLLRLGEQARADGFGVDLAEQMLYLTNASGTLSPSALARVIGPHVVAVLEPYRFDNPPQAQVWGTIDLTGDRHTDQLHIQLSGGPFHWQQFNWAWLQGRVDWVGQTVRVTNVQGNFCGGQMTGHLEVDLAQRPGPVVAFGLWVTNVDLGRLMADLGRATNKLEGSLSGALIVTYANLARSNSWQGQGQLQLTNGLIWDIPIFGIFSPVLNAVVPGLGNSRARHASATFLLANSVLHSRDLQIHATGMRMQYDLRVGFDQTIHGRVEAELLRDMPGLGRVVSKLFWPVTKLFEYRLSGTLDQPRAVPVFFVPRILLFPFRPLKTLEELLPQPSKPAGSASR